MIEKSDGTVKNLPAVQETWVQSLGLLFSGVSLVAQMVKNLPAMWETQVQALRQEDPLARGMAIHSTILALRITWTEEPGGLQSVGLQRVGHD